MSRWIKLVDALQEYKEMYRKFVKYTLHNKVRVLSKDKTGWEEEQVVANEELICHPILIDGKPCLVNKETVFNLFLQGKEGYLNRREILTEYCKLYIDEHLRTIVKPLNETTYKKLPEYIQSEIGDCWLDDGYEATDVIGVKCVLFKHIHGRILHYAVTGKSSYFAFPVCVVIQLPENTLVDMYNPLLDGSCYERALKICINECEIK